MNQKSLKKPVIDPAKLNPTDLIESACMLDATATCMRQSFGIICMFNDLAANPLSESELKNFAQNFDVVHKILRSYGKELFTKGQTLQAGSGSVSK